MPRDYKRVLQAEAKARAEQREPDFAELVGAAALTSPQRTQRSSRG